MRARDIDQAGARVAAERSRLLGRSRRSGEGSVTEMVRSLLRDARDPDEARPAGARSPRSVRFAPATTVERFPRASRGAVRPGRVLADPGTARVRPVTAATTLSASRSARSPLCAR